MADQTINILIVGATGHLGKKITLECLLKSNLKVSILVKDPEKDKELNDLVLSKGGKIFQGDLTKPESLKGCASGIHTIISVVGGGHSVIVDGQKNLLDEALKSGVKRFIPSDFTFDIWNFQIGIQYFIDQRLKFRQIIDKMPINHLHISNGMFIETFLYLNKTKFSYWGSCEQHIDLTAMDDVAKYVAAAVAKPNRTGILRVTGNERTFREYAELYNNIMGKDVPIVDEGSLGHLIEKANEMKEKGNILEYVKLSYLVPLFNNTGKIIDKDNGEFSEIEPISFEEFLIKHKTKLPYDDSIPKAVEKAKIELSSY